MVKRSIKLNENDNVATALVELVKGDHVSVELKCDTFTMTVKDDIPYGHKFSLEDISNGEYVRKYGEIIGIARAAIARGSHVHTHNVISNRGKRI